VRSALIAAIVAAFVSTTAATAVSSRLITSAQIKNRTIQLVDLHPSTIKALKARPPITAVSRDGDSRFVGAGGAAELTAKCQTGETAIGAGWSGAGEVRDLYVFPAFVGNFVAAVFHNTSLSDRLVKLEAVCLRG
jgi:hypothetical protein